MRCIIIGVYHLLEHLSYCFSSSVAELYKSLAGMSQHICEAVWNTSIKIFTEVRIGVFRALCTILQCSFQSVVQVSI